MGFTWTLLRLIAHEHWRQGSIAREVEPEAMVLRDSVAAFHEEGQGRGALVAPYHFNARAISRLLPPGAHVVDLGSGSASFLAFLAERRSDIRITGFELSPAMVELGRKHLRDRGLQRRVQLLAGDMVDFSGQLRRPPSLVISVFALHHLPGAQQLRRCAAQVAQLQRRGCGFWLFDHARPRWTNSAEVVPRLFSPTSPSVFQQDSAQSIRAAFTFGEMSEALRCAGLEVEHAERARLLPLYQIHWARPRPWPNAGHGYWKGKQTSATQRVLARAFARLWQRSGDPMRCLGRMEAAR